VPCEVHDRLRTDKVDGTVSFDGLILDGWTTA
jgi:hypothetical protein